MHAKTHGITLFLSAVFLFALLDAISKYLTGYVSVPVLMWTRYTLQFVVMMVTVAPRMGRQLVLTQHPWLMTLRGLLQMGCSLFVLLAFRVLPLAETTAVVFVTPVLVALLAGPFLGERLSLINWLATLGGFIGVLLIARPGGAMFGWGVLYALCAALCYAVYQVLTRKLSTTEPPMRQFFYIALVGTICTSAVVPSYWTGIMPAPGIALLIVCYGLLTGFGHLLLIRAFHQAPASSLAPLLYFQLFSSVILGGLFFDHWPDLLAITGMVVIGISGFSLVVYRARPLVPPEPAPG